MTGCYSANTIQLSLAINFLILKMFASLRYLQPKDKLLVQMRIIFLTTTKEQKTFDF